MFNFGYLFKAFKNISSGLFEPSHMQYEVVRDVNAEPSLTEMVESAIKLLSKYDQGYTLLIEGILQLAEKLILLYK